MLVSVSALAKRLDLSETSSEDEVRAALKRPPTNEISALDTFLQTHWLDPNQSAIEDWLLSPRPRQ